jgi:hypothetical protein
MVTGDELAILSDKYGFICKYCSTGTLVFYIDKKDDAVKILHYGARTAPTDRAAGLLRSIPAASCSPNLHRPAKCDTTTPCRTNGKRNTPLDKSRARIQTRSRLLLAAYFALKP